MLLKLTAAAQNLPDNYALKAIACVVSHAAKHNVQVTTDMLPFWLKEQSGNVIEECLAEPNTLENTDSQKYIRVTTYECLKDNPDILDTGYKCLYPEEGCLTELRTSYKQNSSQIASRLTDQEQYYGPHILFRVNDASITLEGIRNIELDRQCLWLEYTPAFARQEGYKTWRAHRYWKQNALPGQLQPGQKVIKPDENLSVVLPHLSGEKPLHCTSRNRSLYWRDTLSRFLALIHSGKNEATTVLLVTHRHEVEPLRVVLEQLNQTRPKQDHRSTLRYLEHLHNSGKRLSCRYCAVDHQSNAHAWLEASQELGYPVRLVFDSLPLHEWWMQIAPAEDEPENLIETDDSILQDQGEDETSPTTDGEEDSEANDGDSRHLAEPSTRTSTNRTKERFSRVRLSPSNIQSCVEHGLRPWLRVVLRRGKENIPEVTILDARCHPSSFQNVCSTYQPFSAGLLPMQPVDQKTLLDKLREELGDIERQDAPVNYENTRNF
jgi:hypothetical protein